MNLANHIKDYCMFELQLPSRIYTQPISFSASVAHNPSDFQIAVQDIFSNFPFWMVPYLRSANKTVQHHYDTVRKVSRSLVERQTRYSASEISGRRDIMALLGWFQGHYILSIFLTITNFHSERKSVKFSRWQNDRRGSPGSIGVGIIFSNPDPFLRRML